ncbi:endolytic transglycosylase MltG [candidate division KSB1 bacterium]|nr:endolytic transglycosylase MltG [candidate division KSB1 bacterium]
MKLIIFVVVMIFLFAGVMLFFYPFTPVKEEPIQFRVTYGETPLQIAENLQEKNIISDASLFVFLARLTQRHNQLKAGQYLLPQKSSIYHVLDKLSKGKQSFIKVTVQEGITSRQIAALMEKKVKADSSRFVMLTSDSLFAAGLNIGHSTLEGFLFPETYHFTFGITEEQIIQSMVKLFQRVFDDSLVHKKARDLGYSFYETLILASIIQGEAVLDSEMVYISSVYHNRLERGIPLQADPTIQYIISDGPRRLLNRDLEIDSPYNTYLYAGLPPAPINNPGEVAIRAALNPASTYYLYFVADGRGGHVFSTNLRDHLNAKRKFDKIRARVARQKREEALGNNNEQ